MTNRREREAQEALRCPTVLTSQKNALRGPIQCMFLLFLLFFSSFRYNHPGTTPMICSNQARRTQPHATETQPNATKERTREVTTHDDKREAPTEANTTIAKATKEDTKSPTVRQGNPQKPATIKAVIETHERNQ